MADLEVDTEYADVLNVGDSLEIRYRDDKDSSIEIAEKTIQKIQRIPVRSGEDRLHIDFK